MSKTISSSETKSEMVVNKELPTWEEFIDFSNYYEDCVTLDPSKVEDAWDKLGQSNLYLHISALPALMFFGFKKTYSEFFEEKGQIE